MTVSLVLGGIAVYVGLLAFVLALLTTAERADEAAERQARVLGARDDRLAHPNGELRDGGFAAAAEVRRFRMARSARVPGPQPAQQEGPWAGGGNMG